MHVCKLMMGKQGLTTQGADHRPMQVSRQQTQLPRWVTGLTLCTSTRWSRELKAMLASRLAKLLADSSKAIDLCPLAAAAKENKPWPAPMSSST